MASPMFRALMSLGRVPTSHLMNFSELRKLRMLPCPCCEGGRGVGVPCWWVVGDPLCGLGDCGSEGNSFIDIMGGED